MSPSVPAFKCRLVFQHFENQAVEVEVLLQCAERLLPKCRLQMIQFFLPNTWIYRAKIHVFLQHFPFRTLRLFQALQIFRLLASIWNGKTTDYFVTDGSIQRKTTTVRSSQKHLRPTLSAKNCLLPLWIDSLGKKWHNLTNNGSFRSNNASSKNKKKSFLNTQFKRHKLLVCREQLIPYFAPGPLKGYFWTQTGTIF
jgi:hypothetical protein